FAICFTKELTHAKRIGLLRLEAIAAVDLEEKFIHPKGIDDRAGRSNGLVTQDGHLPRKGVSGAELAQRIDYAIVDVCRIQLVLAIVVEKELKRDVEEVLVFWIA